ncbi:GntR family transcriptional regulator [Naumannella halotolerans]|nr:GntR family transcriptional regulator [Naumannella halotolerans]
MAPKNAQSSADTAYAHLKEAILDGELLGGTMVSEGSIADRLSMSRTPIREAFLRLQAEGWMRLYPKRGALVVEVHPHELEDILEARVVVESAAVRRFERSEVSLAQLRSDLLEQIALQRSTHATGDLGAFTAADAAFHWLIVKAGGNALLADFFATLRERQQRMTARSLWRRDDIAATVIAEHERLTDLIAMGDADAFAAALDTHVRGTHRQLLSPQSR